MCLWSPRKETKPRSIKGLCLGSINPVKRTCTWCRKKTGSKISYPNTPRGDAFLSSSCQPKTCFQFLTAQRVIQGKAYQRRKKQAHPLHPHFLTHQANTGAQLQGRLTCVPAESGSWSHISPYPWFPATTWITWGSKCLLYI